MKTYVKLDIEDKKKAMTALRKIAIDTPKICIMDTGLKEDLALDTAKGTGPGGVPGAGGQGSLDSVQMIMNYFGGPNVISRERCQTILSKSDVELGDNDFLYEWSDNPTSGQIAKLEERIAKELKPMGVKYTVKSY